MTNKRLIIASDDDDDDDDYNDDVLEYIKNNGCDPSPLSKSFFKQFNDKRRKTRKVSCYIN